MKLEEIYSFLEPLALVPDDLSFWANFLTDPTLAQELIDSGGFSDARLEQINADMIRIVSTIPMVGPQFFEIAKAFTLGILRDPDEVHTWDDVITRLKSKENLTSKRICDVLSVLVQNSAFLIRKTEVDPNTPVEEWVSLVKCGELMTSLYQALKILRHNRDQGIFFVKSLFQMFTRIRIPTDISDLEISAEEPKVIVTVHSNFRSEFVVPMTEAHGDHVYSVFSDNLGTAQHVNLQRIVMVKHLKKSTSVIVAVDGKMGKLECEGAVFDRKIIFSDGFAWVAWKANRDVVWAFAGCDPKGAGLKVFHETILKPQTENPDYEAYKNRIVLAFTGALEKAIIQHPFDFGLIYPRRLGSLGK